MHRLSIKQLSEALHQREISSVELTQYFLKRIVQHQSLNAFICTNEEQALQKAKAADQSIQKGQTNALTGIPMAHKDIFCTKHLPTTCASNMLSHYVSPFDATIVKKLDEQGTVMLGKTNMDEFGMGSSSEKSFFGAVQNPWDTSRVAGGSSGGSAVAVAASLIPFATATDTGGSIRQPAAFCGISGIKPTYGLLSRYGMVAYASSLEQAGPMARSAEDLAYILQAMAGHDPKDSTSVNHSIPDYSLNLNKPLANLRIGLPSCFFRPGVDANVQQLIYDAAKLYEQEGAEIVELNLTLESLWVPCYYVIACAEASSNLSRYDGIRFGHRSKKADTVHDMIKHSRNEGFGLEVKRRILTGVHVLSTGYFDAYYLQALKIRRLIQNELLESLKTVDVILGPTAPTCAFKQKKHSDPVQNYLADVFTVAANLAGLPAISIPAGFSQGLPVGLQLTGRFFSEDQLLNIAHQYQQRTHWHQVHPTE